MHRRKNVSSPRASPKNDRSVLVKFAYYIEISRLDRRRFADLISTLRGTGSLLRHDLGIGVDTCQTGPHLAGLRTVRTFAEIHLVFRTGILQLMLNFEDAAGNIMGHGVPVMRKV